MSVRSKRTGYERDDEQWPAEAYTVGGWRGIAWHVLGWETQPDADTEWSGMEERTGNALCVMIGDDQRHSVDPSDLTALDREEFCGVCGQIGCSHDGYDRSDAERAS